MAQCCSLGVISIQTRLNGGHLGSSGFRYGSSGLIRTHADSEWLIWDAGSLGVAGAHQDSDLAHWAHLGSLVVIEIQIWLNGGHLNCDLVHWGLLGLIGAHGD